MVGGEAVGGGAGGDDESVELAGMREGLVCGAAATLKERREEI